MSLPAPNLDDRRFQQLVDDAKRLVQQRCPEWTDHNVSDPGVTLIEAFAGMMDALHYRLNRVPDRHYVKFLELIGVRLFPPTAAEVPVTFWLSAPQPNAVDVPTNTEVTTLRTEREEAIAFTTREQLRMPPCAVTHLAAAAWGGQGAGQIVHHPETVTGDASFACFSANPQPGDAMLIGLSTAVPSCAIVLRFDGDIQGIGVDPTDPPLVWEAWNGEDWEECEIERDETGGLNRPGDVVLHVPRTHVMSSIEEQEAGWVRCRVLAAEEGQPAYSESPQVHGFTAETIGGTAEAIHAQIITDEVIGTSDGVPGERFSLHHRPVVPGYEPVVVEVVHDGAVGDWQQVETFAHSGPNDRHFHLDAAPGEVSFGPAVRLPGGGVRTYGAVPPKGAMLRVRVYHTGGGRRGNVARHAISVLKTSIPYIARIDNRRPAVGGVDGEDIENAKMRGPILLHTRDRAVTAADYEQLARQAAPEAARVRCAPVAEDEPGVVRLLVVPRAADNRGRLEFEHLVPDNDTLRRIAEYLQDRRAIGTRVVVEPPTYQGITVVARLRPRPRVKPERLHDEALEALYRYFNPITGGPDGDGWPFGRPVNVGEVYAVFQQLSGTELVEDARLFPADPLTGERGDAVQRIELDPNALVFSHEHMVRVER
ncbi:MAG: putative baseplate assembly protein [Streptosporangiales bacterium]|nr:putative baseplate assembly protein [Streptosporangiales bacterium]